MTKHLYNLQKKDLVLLKAIGLENLVDDFGVIIGSYMGGDVESKNRARTYMRDFLNSIQHELDPKNLEYLYDEDD
jgi:hypothetical protein